MRQGRSTFFIIMAVTTLVVSSGCKLTNQIGRIMGRGADRISERRLVDPPTVVAMTGPTAVDIDSFGGHVTIIADPTLANGLIEVTRRALHGPGRGDEAESSLAEMAYLAEIVPGALGPELRIRTGSASPEPYFQRLDFEIRLPEVDGVRVRTGRGNVIVRGAEGPVDIVTTDGFVRFMTPRAMRAPVSIVNGAGDIDYRVRAESTGDFDCTATRGIVQQTVKYGNMVVHRGTTHNRLLATFNEGPNRIALNAYDGDIRIAIVENPTGVGTFIRD